MIQWLYILIGFSILILISACFKNEEKQNLVFALGIPLIVIICLMVIAIGCPSIHSVCNDSYPQYEPIN